jgi:hypothetical protein
MLLTRSWRNELTIHRPFFRLPGAFIFSAESGQSDRAPGENRSFVALEAP